MYVIRHICYINEFQSVHYNDIGFFTIKSSRCAYLNPFMIIYISDSNLKIEYMDPTICMRIIRMRNDRVILSKSGEVRQRVEHF